MLIIATRDRAIDAARGIALFLVVLSHAHRNPHYVTTFYIIAFFFLSGWLYKPGKSYRANIKKKAIRVVLPYFLNSLVLLLIYAAMNSFSYDFIKDAFIGIIYSRNVIEIGGSPLMIVANAPLWYLTAFFTTSLLFHVVIDRYTENWQKFLLLSVVLVTVSILLSKLPILLPWSIEMVPFYTIVMMVGYIMKKQNLNLNISFYPTILLLFGYIVTTHENGAINLSLGQFGGGKLRL